MTQPIKSEKPAPSFIALGYIPRAAALMTGRHSAYSDAVYWLKTILPIMAALLLLAISIWPNLIENENRFQLSTNQLAEDAPQASVIVGPKYIGTTGSGLNYTVKASHAAPSLENTDAINLKNLRIDVKAQNDTAMTMTANRATYWRTRNGMAAEGDITVKTNQNHTMRAKTAYADFGRSVVWSDAPISGEGPNGTFKADGFEITQDGSQVLLRGKVDLSLIPSHKPGHKSIIRKHDKK